MTFLDDVARIRDELLGMPEKSAHALVIATALPLMGVVPEPTWTLQQTASAIVAAMTAGDTKAAAAVPAAAPAAPAAPAARAPAPAAASIPSKWTVRW
jgi:hypothetical protein